MKYDKQKLIAIAQAVDQKKSLRVEEIEYLLDFEKIEKDSPLLETLKSLAVPLSLAFGFMLTVFSPSFESIVERLPAWTNLPPDILAGVDYLWNLLSEPIEKSNILYHIPNLILYSFGIVGVKQLIETLERQTWLDKVLCARDSLKEQITAGTLALQMKKGHSLLFVGKGDFIAMQFTLNHDRDKSVIISQVQPSYTKFWNFYTVDSLYDDLKQVIMRASGENAGEYIFFPVKDDQIFLPNHKAYDLAPHKLDILCQNIRVIEKEQKWKPKRIMIIGDKFHNSFVQSEDHENIIPKSQDTISLETIAKKYSDISLFDPTDIVLRKILKIANKRKIIFRATKEGIVEYKKRFYERLLLLGYEPASTKKGVLTIGYDLFEDQTEQQTLARTIDDYYPVVLSKNVRDALIRNGYKKQEFLYVPELVLETITQAAAQQ